MEKVTLLKNYFLFVADDKIENSPIKTYLRDDPVSRKVREDLRKKKMKTSRGGKNTQGK